MDTFNYNELHIIPYTSKESGKMRGIPSLSTACIYNSFCMANRKINGSVCQKCYAFNSLKRYKNLFKLLKINTELLTMKELNRDSIPFLNYSLFRFESHGDIQNKLQLENYLKIVEKNKYCNFTLWTKNYNLTEKYFSENKKPKNLILIYSSLFLNVKINITDFNYCDKIFTVYTKEFISKNKIKINCGSNSCINCRKCYTKNRIKYINEKKK